jgi:uncharacterized iron-regulated membrane protein
MRGLRKILFQLHMWIGLGLGLLLIALGLSGSVLVYDDVIQDFLAPAPRASAQGAPLPLDRIIAAARASTTTRGPATVTPAGEAGAPAIVRIGAAGRGGAPVQSRGAAGPGRAPAKQIYVDPVSGIVIGSAPAALPPILAFAHQLHGNFMMGQDGRRFVGYLGLAMVILGVSGLVLWWPKKGQWKNAFIVRRTAKGLRFHRELHGMLGIWMYVVFIAVSYSGMALAWPQLTGMPVVSRTVPMVAPLADAAPIGADQALALVKAQAPDMTLRTVMVPPRRAIEQGQPITVSFFSHGAVGATAYVDPLRAKVIEVRDPSASFMAWQRPMHQGLLGPVWRFLVFLSGFLPTVFVFTGVFMWLKKRQNRMSMNAPLVMEPAE